MKMLILIVDNDDDKFQVLEKLNLKLINMQNKLSIKNKNLKTEIIFRKNYISKFIVRYSNKNEKVFLLLGSKVKII